MKKFTSVCFLPVLLVFLSVQSASAASRRATPTENPVVTASSSALAASSSATLSPDPTQAPRQDFTQKTEVVVEPLKKLLDEQKIGSVFPGNFIKYAIRAAVNTGVPPNTIVLLLLLPGVAALIAATRHLIGLRGFGIFLPAALSVVFLAMGPIVGIGLFLIIVFVSTITRIGMRRFKVKLQYLPRMALLLQFVVLGILALLFSAPVIKWPDFSNASIFPVLILVLLAEDFTRVQMGKSIKVAADLAIETLILALLSYIFLSLKIIQEFALLKPEIWIVSIIMVDILMGKYIGLRFLEFWRFRKLINS